jgi:serine-type D-Ala-D-Ala carboxypeptidase/endopeptidase (penicillin-binding protein 4)
MSTNYVNTSARFRSRSRRSRARKRRALAVVVLFVAVAIALLVARGHSAAVMPAAAVADPPAPAVAPVQPAWSNADVSRLRSQLQTAFAAAIDGSGGWSLAVISADGRMLYDDGAQRAVAPASVQKLIVAATALDALGPAYRYDTLFAGSDGIDDGTLDGNLWLIGSGDPSLASADLRNGVGVLVRSGLRRVNGGLIVDATSLKGPALNPHWGNDDNGQDYAAPTSAISLDGDTIESSQEVDGVDQSVWTPMQDVTRYVAASANAMLAARGVAQLSPPAVGAAPLPSVVLWDHRSAPLTVLESHMLFVSDNHYAEQLLRTVGEQAAGLPDDAGGIAAERRFLQQNGIPVPGLRLFDGSGLSADNRLAAITLARLLAVEETSLYKLLPLGGRQGTLADYDFTTALGRVRAKSGHISGVCALAGYVTTLHHGRVAFAFLINGSSGDADEAIVSAVDRLAMF